MRIYKTKEFGRFARREKINDVALCETVDRAERGLIDADLGSGLIKQRVARPGQGRSGGFRTLLAYRAASRTVFVYGFAKSERGNIDQDERAFWRTVAAAFLAMSVDAIENAIVSDELKEVLCDA